MTKTKNINGIQSRISYGLVLLLAVLFTFTYIGCKKEEEPDTKDNDPDPVAAQVDYIKFDGYRLEMKNPAKGTLKDQFGDTLLTWRGNEPTGIDGDTVLTINMGAPARGSSAYDKFVSIPLNSNEIRLYIEWGTSANNPAVLIKSGTYKIERQGGFWVSTLTNGTREWDRGGGDIETFTGIEFRATWPD